MTTTIWYRTCVAMDQDRNLLPKLAIAFFGYVFHEIIEKAIKQPINKGSDEYIIQNTSSLFLVIDDFVQFINDVISARREQNRFRYLAFFAKILSSSFTSLR